MDVWDEDGEEPGQMAHIEREHHNQGYLDGITKAKESSLQDGFDNGYPHGAEVGLQAGRIIGALQGLGLHDLEASALRELDAARLFSYDFYDKDAKPTFMGKHPTIEKWETLLQGMQETKPAVKLTRRK